VLIDLFSAYDMPIDSQIQENGLTGQNNNLIFPSIHAEASYNYV
jgi:hypothetical protein